MMGGIGGCRVGLRCGAGIAAILAQAAMAQDTAGAQRQARIEALEAKVQRIESELSELRQVEAELAALRRAERGGADQRQTTAAAAPSSAAGLPPAAPTSVATADLSKVVPQGAANASPPVRTAAAPRIFGPGIPTTAAVSRIDAGHPVIATADGRFSASLIGIMQFDVADYFQRAAGPLAIDLRRAGAAADTARARNLSDGSTFRRARIGIAGKAFGDFEYSVLFDFGGAGIEDSGHVQELWLQYSGWKPAHVRVGAFAPFIGLEDAGSTNGMLFLERPTSAEIARGIAGGEYREGAQIAFTGKRWFASGALTGRLVNTAGANATQSYQGQLGFVARGGLLPIRTNTSIVHLAVHGSYVDHPSNTGGPDITGAAAFSPVQLRDRPELRVDATRLIDTGAIDAIHAWSAGAEFAAQHRAWMVQGEVERLGIVRRNSPLPDPRFKGYYVEGSWIVTGQQRRYNDGNYAFDGPQLQGSFDPAAGNWGAWELALRWSDTDLDYRAGSEGMATPAGGVRGGEQKIFTAGVNWYLNSIARIMLDYQRVDIARLSPNPTTFQTPIGAPIGQKYSTGSMRFQLAF